MKNILILSSLILLSFSSCQKRNCPSKNCNTTVAACEDLPPTDELCQAAFNRWFYNSHTGQCTQIGYSGCAAKGFETKQDCEDCGCN
jgi:hypothetical protein